MKKFISLLLAITMLYCICPSVFATNYTEDDDREIKLPISYTSAGTEEYTVTVPLHLEPGASGVVTVEGKWASNRKLTVTAPATVILTNNINSADRKLLTISFSGIYKVGNNTNAIKTTDDGSYATISVSNIDNALFGEWKGIIYYDVKMEDVT